MKTLVIMRGISGAGKSTRAKEIAGVLGVICSADDYFVGEDGIYRFKPESIRYAHWQCEENVVLAMINQTELIVVDNTNTKKWEYKNYLHMAAMYSYEVKIEMVGNLTDVDLYFNRNTHGVPIESIKKMAARFEL